MTGLELPVQGSGGQDGHDWRSGRPRWLYDAVLAGSLPSPSPEDPTRSFPLATVAIGSISLPDGLLVACDPFVANDNETPFVQALPTGEHVVAVVRATVGENHGRNAAPILLVDSPGPIARWEMALRPGQDLSVLTDPTGYYGYGVDAGTGSFASPAGQAAATAALAADGGMLETPFSTAALESPINAVVSRPNPYDPDVAVFHSGWGDGSYPTWLGRDDEGQVILALTDFLLTADPFTPDEPPPAPKASVAGQSCPSSGLGILKRLRRSH